MERNGVLLTRANKALKGFWDCKVFLTERRHAAPQATGKGRDADTVATPTGYSRATVTTAATPQATGNRPQRRGAAGLWARLRAYGGRLTQAAAGATGATGRTRHRCERCNAITTTSSAAAPATGPQVVTYRTSGRRRGRQQGHGARATPPPPAPARPPPNGKTEANSGKNKGWAGHDERTATDVCRQFLANWERDTGGG